MGRFAHRLLIGSVLAGISIFPSTIFANTTTHSNREIDTNSVMEQTKMTFEEPLSSPGVHDLVFTTSSGAQVNYSLGVPASLDSHTPLLLVLHYAGQPTAYYGRPLLESLVGPALASLAPVMIAPTSLGGDWSNENNQNAVFELIDAIESQYETNPNRRVVTGYSMGGIGSWLFQGLKPAYFSAAIPIAGYREIPAEKCLTPISVLLSKDDGLFATEKLNTLVNTLVEAGCEVKQTMIDGVDHYNIVGYSEVLKAQADWLRAIWARE